MRTPFLMAALILCTLFLHSQCEAQAQVTYIDDIPVNEYHYGPGTTLGEGSYIRKNPCRLIEMTLATPPPPAPPVERWHITCLLIEEN